MDAILPWLTLKNVPGIGNALFKRLLGHFDSPQAVLEASKPQLMAVAGIASGLADTIRTHRTPTPAVKREYDLIAKRGYRMVTLADANYPSLLREIPDPPPYLYVYGLLTASENKIAVVGSRHATSYGLTTTKRLCKELVAQGLAVVSGMARGIDTAAHQAALDGQGATIAVLGSGLENVYPRENERLFHQIAENGAVVSEFRLQAEPDGRHFPARNRIISGMALGAVIVEATLRSGSLITARLAAEQNREVFAVPGSIASFKSTGTHHLLKQGAKLVEHVQDVLEELTHRQTAPKGVSAPKSAPGAQLKDDSLTKNPAASKKPVPAVLDADEKKIIDMLEPYPQHIDDIIRKSAMAPGIVASILLNLEIKGLVFQTPGKFFATCEVNP
jgi:DNA processing protein